MLTEAFVDPTILCSAKGFSPRYSLAEYFEASMSRSTSQRVLLIRRELNEGRASIMTLMAHLLSIAVGILVGVTTGRADLSVAVGTGFLTAVHLLHAILVWRYC